MANKPSLKYAIVTGKKPGTSETVLWPKITDRLTYYIDSVVEYALNSGYVRGKIDDMTGVLRGFFRACKELVNSGFAVNLADWIRIHPELTGSVGEDRQLDTSTNGIKVDVTPLLEMKKLTIDDFSWTSVDTGVPVKITSVNSPGGNAGEVKKNGKFLFIGKNMQFNASLGDKMTVSYDGLETPIGITPTEQDAVHQLYDWPAALAEVEVGEILEFKLISRGGVEGAPDQVHTIYAKLVAA